ncbi:MAG: MFS transporter [Pseudomonadota bacterium]
MLDSTRTAVAGTLNNRVFYGWVMVSVAALGLFASGPGQSHTFSVFNDLIARDLGISLEAVTWAYGADTVLAAFLLPIMGRQVDRFGARRSLIGIAGGLGLACIAFGAVAGMLWLVIGFAALRFLGQGSMMLGSANLVAQWFTAKRGFAMSLMALGFALSIAIHPKLGQLLIDLYDWRTAWIALGIMTWVMMLPVLVLIVFDRPSALGLYPDNAPPAEGETAPELTGPELGEALRHPSFYLICAVWFGLSALVTSLHFHQVNIMTFQGLAADRATDSFVFSSIAMVCLMPLVGRACDRFRTRYVVLAALIVQSSSLIAVTQVDSVPTMFVYAALFGLNNAFTMTLFGYVWPRYFGRKHLGRIQGTGQMVAVIGASIGPIPVSRAFDASGDPSTVIWWLATYPIVIGVLAVLFLRTHPKVQGTEHLE